MTAKLAEGERLFDAGKFFEAHEAFEDAWREASGEDRRFFQGLAQLAAAFVHLQREGHSAPGAPYLLEKAKQKLERRPELCAQIDDALAAAREGKAVSPPRLSLPG